MCVHVCVCVCVCVGWQQQSSLVRPFPQGHCRCSSSEMQTFRYVGTRTQFCVVRAQHSTPRGRAEPCMYAYMRVCVCVTHAASGALRGGRQCAPTLCDSKRVPQHSNTHATDQDTQMSVPLRRGKHRHMPPYILACLPTQRRANIDTALLFCSWVTNQTSAVACVCVCQYVMAGLGVLQVMACPSGCLNGGGQIKPQAGQTAAQVLEQAELAYNSASVSS